MENTLINFREGNFVKYFGQSSRDFRTYGQLIEINDENGFVKLKISGQFQQKEEEIYADINEIRSVYTTPKMLNDLGFSFDEKTRLFAKDGKKLAYIKYVKKSTNIYGHEEGLMIVDRGFRIIEGNEEGFLLNEEEMLNNTSDAHALHIIQNYWNIILKSELDTSNLKPLWQY